MEVQYPAVRDDSYPAKDPDKHILAIHRSIHPIDTVKCSNDSHVFSSRAPQRLPRFEAESQERDEGIIEFDSVRTSIASVQLVH